MKRRQFLSLLTSTSMLSACKEAEIRRGISTSEKILNGDFSEVINAEIPDTGIEEVDQIIRHQVKTLVNKLAEHWADKKIATPKEYVKYSDKYFTRAIINFSDGHIRVETVDPKTPKAKLKAAIIETLLTPDNPSKVDLLSDKAIQPGETPFLYDLVHDQDNKPIKNNWRASRYADFLLAKQYKVDRYEGQQRHAVQFTMVTDYRHSQQTKFAVDVKRQSKRYALDEALIYAIIETESAFNPFAISPAPAYGLMQIVPHSAGRDAYQLIHNKPGTPSKDYLFKANQNIEMGSAYLHILFSRYLVRVKNPRAREYCVIAGYNTGSGNVLKAFDSDRTRAFSKINQLSEQQVYQHLRKNLRYEEARNYLFKVTQNKAKYSLAT